MLIKAYVLSMAPPAVVSDVFHAVAEPRRRQILDLLRGGERPAGDVVKGTGLPQPQVSKHLRVLREVGLVHVRRSGRQRLYSLRPAQLRRVHDWVSEYERFWESQLDRLQAYAEREAQGSGTSGTKGTPSEREQQS